MLLVIEYVSDVNYWVSCANNLHVFAFVNQDGTFSSFFHISHLTDIGR